MTPRHADDKPEALREMVRFVVDQNKVILDQQHKTNLEVIRLSHVVYGDQQNNVPGLVGHNTSHMEQLAEVATWKNRLIGAIVVLSGLITFLAFMIALIWK